MVGRLGAARRRPLLGRVTVRGSSMVPALDDGDRLLVVRTRRPRPGDVVVVRDPRDTTRLVVKRVAAVTGGGVVVRGDNPGASTDSRTFGPVAVADVVGRALYRYSPAASAGRVPRGRPVRSRP